ncbi:PAS domain S-box protein, partial [Streptomyces carpinensis]
MEQVSATAVVDAHGIVTGWSEGARRLTGYPAEEVVGRPVRALLAVEPPAGAATALSGSAVLRHRDGSTVV